MARPDHLPPLAEVLLEPGLPRLWVTAGELTYLLDCAPLLASGRGAPLRLPRVWRAVSTAPDGLGLRWPGLTLPWSEALPLSVAQMLPRERYRPLLPYLRGHEPPLVMAPVTTSRLQTLLAVQPYQLQRAAECLQVDSVLAEQRLYDAGALLAEYVGYQALPSLLRRPWPVARRLQNPLLESMRDCLLGGRPDLVERMVTALVLEGV